MTLKIVYHAEENAAYIHFSEATILESGEVAPNVIFDYDTEGRIVGIELLDARALLAPELLAQAVNLPQA